jgi:protein TonB
VIIAQSNFPLHYSKDDSTFLIAAEEMPEPVDGIEDIESKLYYTEEAVNAKIEGHVYLTAFVDEEGKVVKVKIAWGLGYGLDESARNAVLNTKFIPGKIDGKPVRVAVMIPIVFKLD